MQTLNVRRELDSAPFKGLSFPCSLDPLSKTRFSPSLASLISDIASYL
jgi:hypothetical protein